MLIGKTRKKTFYQIIRDKVCENILENNSTVHRKMNNDKEKIFLHKKIT